MADFLVSLPPAAKNIRPKLVSFTREGKDGNEVIVPIFSGDRFIGEVLEGGWLKDSDGDILSNTAILSGGHLELSGKSHSAGNHDYHWLVHKHHAIIKDGLTLTVALEAPAVVSASRGAGIELDLISQYPTGNDPQNEDDWLKIQLENDNGTYQFRIRKNVDGTESNVQDWTEVTNPNVVFKLVFDEEGKGTTAISVDDGETGNFEAIDESPSALDLNFKVAYAVLCMETDDATSRTVLCDYLTFDYPASVNVPQLIKYDLPLGAKAGTETLFTEAEDVAVEYSHSLPFTVPASKVDEDVEDFPTLFLIRDGSGINGKDLTPVFDELGSESLKLKIVDSLGNQCYVEVVSWDEIGEFAELWFKAPSLSSTVDNLFTLYFDAGKADNTDYVGVTGSTPAKAVWDSNFKMVQHMNDATTSTITDSTSNDNDGTKTAANEPIEATGKIGKAQDFDGGDDAIKIASLTGALNGDSKFTLECWVTFSGIVAHHRAIVGWWWNRGNTLNIPIDSGAVAVYVGADGDSGVTSTGNLNDGIPHYIVATYDKDAGADNIKLYVDGVLNQVGTQTGTIVSTDKFNIGSINDLETGVYNLLGAVDEARWSEETVRSSAWVGASYETQTDSFIEFGVFVDVGGGGIDLVDLADDSGTSAALDAQDEYVRYAVTSLLSQGRYLALFRIKDTAQVEDDVQLKVYNSTDASYLNVENAAVLKTAEGTFNVYELLFDVDTEDAGDTCYLEVLKAKVTANTVYVDWLRVIPYGSQNGKCKVFDTMGEASEDDWNEVYDPDHSFVGDCVLQNGLIRAVIDELAENGLKLYLWTNNSWLRVTSYPYWGLETSAKTLQYHTLKNLLSVNSEEIKVKGLSLDTAVNDRDYYVEWTLTIRRGNFSLEFMPLSAYPPQQIYYYDSAGRWGFANDAETYGIADADLSITVTNTDFTENFMLGYDDDGNPAVFVISSSKEPTASLLCSQGANLSLLYVNPENFKIIRIFESLIPFSRVSSLFAEAEDQTLGGGASTSDEADDSGESAELGAQNESVTWTLDPVNDSLPQGRYLALFRIKDANQIADDVGVQVYNDTDGTFKNQENAKATKTATAAWAIYQLVFNVDAEDDGDSISITVNKELADANTILVDYFLIVFMGDGESGPQDIAHQSLRKVKSEKQIVDARLEV